MLCRRCERRVWTNQLLRFWTSPRIVWGTAALGDVSCARCGTVLPPDLVTERFLGKLAHLNRVGLGAAQRPLLERAGKDR